MKYCVIIKQILIICFLSLSNFLEAINGIKSSHEPELAFIENKGQVSDQSFKPRPDVLFSGEDDGMAFHVRNNGISYQLSKIDTWKDYKNTKTDEIIKTADRSSIYRIDINWLGINAFAKITKGYALDGFNNYYLASCPNGIHNVRSYASLTYNNIYDRIDLKYYSNKGKLKYDYIVRPGGNYHNIQFEIKGAESLSINAKGDLVVKTPFGDIIEQAPIVFQQGRQIPAKWKLLGNKVSFDIEKHDLTKELIIDPEVAVRVWGTYYGGNKEDYSYATCVDASGNVFITGQSINAFGTIIATTGSFLSASMYVFGGNYDAFLTKFNSNGVRLWGTYYGGTQGEVGKTCSADKYGNVYMAGDVTNYSATYASSIITTPGSHQELFGGGYWDAFLVKFDPNGARIWGTYYGGLGEDYANGSACDTTGNIYITGLTKSANGTSIATALSHQDAFAGGFAGDAFLVKFSQTGVREWATYYGGAMDDYGYSCAIDTAQNVFMSGKTMSNSGNEIATLGCHQLIYGGGSGDAFLVRFSSVGTRLWGTYYGGIDEEKSLSCTTSKNGKVYLTGDCGFNSAAAIITGGCHQSIPAFSFLAQFDLGGVRQWGTYYGDPSEEIMSCAVDQNNNIYIGGYTIGQVTTNTLIATAGSHKYLFNGAGTYKEAFVAKFNDSGIRTWGTYYGSNSMDEIGYGIAVDLNDNVFLTGITNSTFTVNIATPAGHQPNYGGGVDDDGFLVKFKSCNAPDSPTNTTISNNMIICSGKTTTLSASGAGNLSWYTAATGGSFISQGNTLITPILNSNITYYVQDTNMCVGSLRTPITVTVNSSPNVVISGTSSVCYGHNIVITATGANTYTWNTNAITQAIFITPLSTSSYTVIGTAVNGCTTMAIKTVTVIPNATVTISSSQNPLCVGETATLTGFGGVNYVWYPSTFSQTIAVTPTTTSIYTVSGTFTNSCYAEKTITLTVNQLPVLNLATSGNPICSGSSATLLASGASSYSWSTGGNTNQIIVTPTVNTSYTVTGIDANLCVNTVTYTQWVNQLPVITTITSDTIICSGNSATLTGAGGNTYTWSIGGNNSQIVISPTVNTTYTLLVTDVNGCVNSATITQQVSPCTGLDQNFITSNINVYPNPTNSKFIISGLNDLRLVKVRIFDVYGRRINDKATVSDEIEIDLSDFSNGIYFVEIRDESCLISTLKVLKN